jgi:hypothetical protein
LVQFVKFVAKVDNRKAALIILALASGECQTTGEHTNLGRV